jgi:hypothetical protein
MSEYDVRDTRDKMLETHTITITHLQEVYASWYVDILIYIVVLNLFVEFSEAIFIDSFTISILTAILLKLLLEFFERLEWSNLRYFQQKEGTAWKVLGIVVIASILVLSKFVILEVVNLVFGDRVELGHFLDVIALILTMIIARALAVWIYRWLGKDLGNSETA